MAQPLFKRLEQVCVTDTGTKTLIEGCYLDHFQLVNGVWMVVIQDLEGNLWIRKESCFRTATPKTIHIDYKKGEH